MRSRSGAVLSKRSAFTLLELLLVLFVLVVLAGMLIPPYSRAPRKAASMVCIGNLKQVSIASWIYAADHQDRFPWSLSSAEAEGFIGTIVDCYRTLESSSPSMVQRRALICPTDSKRSSTTNTLQATNLSYFINLSSRFGTTNQVLAGDRRLSTNGVAIGPGRITLDSGLSTGWTQELHPLSRKKSQGNVVFVDGSVSGFGGSTTVQAAFNRSGLTNQTLLVP